MNKDEAKARIEAIEREAAELRRIIEAPEQTLKPEDLVGKLCYVWDGDNRPEFPEFECIKTYDGTDRPWRTRKSWYDHAEPVPAAEVENMIYRKSRYDWSKAPEWAKIAVTNKDGSIHYGSYNDATSENDGSWYGNGKGEWYDFDKNTPCTDWRESLERRP